MNTLRPIESRYAGQTHGPITRLISPQDLGERLKPFIFLDFFSAKIGPGFGFPMHPHSGIATLTWQPGCDVQYEDTTGQSGLLKAGGLEWMNAGGGAWHKASLMGEGHAEGFQLWVPMPPGIEDGPAFGQYVAPETVVTLPIPGGEIRLLLGSLDADDGSPAIRSPIESHQDMNYLVLSLQMGAQWRYTPPPEHDVVWAFVFKGNALIQNEPSQRELLTFGTGDGDVLVRATTEPTLVLIGSAKRHDHALVLGPSSVHTSRESLQCGLARIREVRHELALAGRLRSS
jgi:redox-sensitive bicupin YhaK (pirin superfamily)